ncbi:MAG: ATP-binding protein, partial [Polyangiaceae bacterium]
EETSTGVSIAFRDDGEGMGEEALAQAVSPFFTTRPTGTGLGLPIVRRIAEAHGGHVELRSTLGQGTTVTLSLPRKAPLEPPPSQREPLRSLSVLP